MKDTYVFYGVCFIAVLAIAAVGIGYAINILPLHKQNTITATTSDTTNIVQPDTAPTRASKSTAAPKEKDCGCCAERRAKYEEMIRKRRERRKAAATAQQMASQ
ncbi:hypothetical protein C6503_16590 [Candidatus Poribacteria bacterium]|nr:MAG: hypothetical protein C6503_16590 [Candidatus Poribacteria bacterium]